MEYDRAQQKVKKPVDSKKERTDPRAGAQLRRPSLLIVNCCLLRTCMLFARNEGGVTLLMLRVGTLEV